MARKTQPVLPGRIGDQDLQQLLLGAIAKLGTIPGALARIESALTNCLGETAAAIGEKIDTVDALQIFSFAAYASLEAPEDSAFPSLGVAWDHLDILTLEPYPSRGITVDAVNSTFSFDYDGVYRFSISGSMAHNETNQGREFGVRLYNVTKGTATRGVDIFTGRNQPGSAVNGTVQFFIDESVKGDTYRVELGGGSTYSAIVFGAIGIDICAVSEWSEPVP